MRTEDGRIVFQCLNGDPAAFGLLVDKYKASIYALAYSKLHNFHDAEDIAQEAFIKAYRKLHTLRWWDNFLAWLYAITSNLCKDWIRSQSGRPDREFLADQDPDVLERPSMDFYRNGLVRESIDEALESLPEMYSQVLTLYYLGGMSSKEIARFLGTSPNTVAQRLRRGRARLKEEMIAMMSATYEQQRLHASFTFRIVEAVKRIQIRPLPHTQWLPWGVSALVGVIFTALSLTSPLLPMNPVRISLAISAIEHEKLLTQHSGLKESRASFYGQSGEMPVYAYVPVSMGILPSVHSQPLTAGPSGASAEGQAQAIGSEESPIAAAASEMAFGKEETITISGKVLRDDIPVANARVYIYDGIAEPREMGRTQDDGTFQFQIPKPGEERQLTVVAQHPDHSFGWTKLPKDVVTGAIVKLRKPMAITGTVMDVSGNSIQNIDVQVQWVQVAGAPSEESLSGQGVPDPVVKTDVSGSFAFHNLPAGLGINLDFIGTGYAKQRIFNVQPGTEGIRLKLKPEGRIAGRVTYGKTGEPAKNILLYAQGLYPTDTWAEARTDENGYYILTNLPAGNYTVSIRDAPPDLVGTMGEDIKVTEGQTVENVDLQLVEGEIITGRITDKDTGEPIQGHWVNIARQNMYLSHGYTDENGIYRLRVVPGKMLIYTSAPKGYQDVGQVREEVNVVAGEAIPPLDFQFEKDKSISLTGRVITFEGEPVAGAVIIDRGEWFKPCGTSDGDGRFTITGIRPGQKLSVKAEQRELQLRGFADIDAQPDTEVEILMERYETTSVSGRVVDEQGQPVPSAQMGIIMWETDLGRGLGTSAGLANSSGEYTVAGLIVGDEYYISANAEGYREGKTGQFTLTANMPPLPDIVLRPRGSFFLEGMVADTDGNPVAGAKVTARSLQDEPVLTDKNGHYRLDSLPFTVEVSMVVVHPDYGDSSFGYIPTNETHNFVIAKAERYLAGRIVDGDGNPVVGAAVWVEPNTDEISGHVNVGCDTDLQGGFRLENVADEVVSVAVSSNALKYSKLYENVRTNRDDVVFVFDKSLEPPDKPPTAEQTARREYVNNTRRRSEDLPGKPAPELDVAQWLYGGPVTLAELRGSVVILYFWAGGYVNDIRHIEAVRLLNVLQKEYGEKGLSCIGIHRSKELADEQRKIISDTEIVFRIALDRESTIPGARGVTFDRYADAWGPVVIDKKGIVYGNMSDFELEETVRKLVSEQ